MEPLVKVDVSNKEVLIVTLNHPEKRNCLSIAMMEELLDCLKVLDRKRVVVLEGEGKAFCSGLDLNEVNKEGIGPMGDLLAEILLKLKRSDTLSIASVKGAAVAGGLGLVAACDLAIAEENTLFGLPELNRGIVPKMIMPYLKAKISDAFIKELAFGGKYVDAKRAYQMGLLMEVVPEGALDAKTEELVASILEGNTQAIIETKKLINGIS